MGQQGDTDIFNQGVLNMMESSSLVSDFMESPSWLKKINEASTETPQWLLNLNETSGDEECDLEQYPRWLQNINLPGKQYRVSIEEHTIQQQPRNRDPMWLRKLLKKSNGKQRKTKHTRKAQFRKHKGRKHHLEKGPMSNAKYPVLDSLYPEGSDKEHYPSVKGPRMKYHHWEKEKYHARGPMTKGKYPTLDSEYPVGHGRTMKHYPKLTEDQSSRKQGRKTRTQKKRNKRKSKRKKTQETWQSDFSDEVLRIQPVSYAAAANKGNKVKKSYDAGNKQMTRKLNLLERRPSVHVQPATVVYKAPKVSKVMKNYDVGNKQTTRELNLLERRPSVHWNKAASELIIDSFRPLSEK